MSGTRTGVKEQHGRTATGCEDPRARRKHIFTETYVSPTFCWSAGLNRPSESPLVAHDRFRKSTHTKGSTWILLSKYAQRYVSHWWRTLTRVG
jgi:hypothetical protein